MRGGVNEFMVVRYKGPFCEQEAKVLICVVVCGQADTTVVSKGVCVCLRTEPWV